MTWIHFDYIFILEALIVIYFFSVNAVYFILNTAAFFRIRNYVKARRLFNYRESFTLGIYKPVSIIVPAYNEEVTIVDSVNSMLVLNYPEYEVIVVNDGSSDNTFSVLEKELDLVQIELNKDYAKMHPEIKSIYSSKTKKVTVVNRKNGGKAAALNTGIHVSRYPLVCNIDSDSILDRDALLIVARPFSEDNRVIATGGIVRVANDCEIKNGEIKTVRFPRNILAGFQVVEYLRAFLMGRVGWDAMNNLLIISGAFGVFKKSVLKEVGGYAKDCIGEDMELIVRLHRHMRDLGKKYRITFVPDPVCWTEVPTNIKTLARQRSRWHRGLIDVMWRHKRMFCNPKYGILGLFTYPYFVFIEIFGPVIELGGYLLVPLFYYLGILNFPFFIAYFILAFLLGSFMSIFSILLEEISYRKYKTVRDLFFLMIFSFLETFFFRPLTVVWRVEGIFGYLSGQKKWGEMKRKGFGRK